MSVVQWARLRINCVGQESACPYRVEHWISCFHSVTYASLRRWWPVYVPAHVDRTLGLGPVAHYHLAVNRLTDATVRRTVSAHIRAAVILSFERGAQADRDILTHCPIAAHDVEELSISRPAPIIGANGVPTVYERHMLPMLREWAQERGIPCEL